MCCNCVVVYFWFMVFCCFCVCCLFIVVFSSRLCFAWFVVFVYGLVICKFWFVIWFDLVCVRGVLGLGVLVACFRFSCVVLWFVGWVFWCLLGLMFLGFVMFAGFFLFNVLFGIAFYVVLYNSLIIGFL